MSYGRTRKDFEYLETLKELDDWVEIDGRVLELMRNPSKQSAEDMYQSCMSLWFTEAVRDGTELTRRARSIRDRYDF